METKPGAAPQSDVSLLMNARRMGGARSEEILKLSYSRLVLFAINELFILLFDS